MDRVLRPGREGKEEHHHFRCNGLRKATFPKDLIERIPHHERITGHLRAWFDEEPWRTSRELLERLQAEYPGQYPDHLLRTLQRRVKMWRKEKAHAMVFGPIQAGEPMTG